MNIPVGGRGKKVKYATKLVRVPSPLERQVGELKSRYYGFVDAGGDPDKPVNWITDGETLTGEGDECVAEKLAEIVHRWEERIDNINVKKNVRYSQAAVLLKELQEFVYKRGGE